MFPHVPCSHVQRTTKPASVGRVSTAIRRRFAPVSYGDSRRFAAIRGDAPFARAQGVLFFTRFPTSNAPLSQHLSVMLEI